MNWRMQLCTLVLSAALGAMLLTGLIAWRTISDGTLSGTVASGQESTQIAQVDPCKPNKCR